MATPEREHIDISLHLLDKRIVDVDGEPVAKVDDLEFSEDGEGAPVLTALLFGPEALGARLGGWLGTFVAGFARLRPDGQREPRIPLELVDEHHRDVVLSVRRDELDAPRSERWLREHVIQRIPGGRSEGSGGDPGRAERDREGTP